MLRLRPYRKNDSKKISCWCRDSISFYQWSEGRLGDFPVSPERIEQAVSGRIDNEKYFPFTAFDETGAVGFFTLRQPGENSEELSFGYVILRPESRGKGYGKQMLKLGMKFAFELYGITKVSLEVFENNPDAYYCYKSVGFRENGNVTSYDLCGEKWKSIEMEITQYNAEIRRLKMERTEIAKNYFAQKCHCSQAVLAALADAVGISQKTALRLGSCFGGGMRKGEVCGACTGALIALGLKYGMHTVGDFENQQIADEYAKRFMTEFAAQNGSYLCRELLKVNLANEEERQYAREHGLFTTVCPKLIESAVLLAEAFIEEQQ